MWFFNDGELGLTFADDLSWIHIGDVINYNGKNYKVTKKTTTTLAVERYYWFNKFIDKLFKG